MLKTGDSPAPGIRISRDRMMLTVTNVCPAFQKKTEQEVRQDISARLCQIFIKYA